MLQFTTENIVKKKKNEITKSNETKDSHIWIYTELYIYGTIVTKSITIIRTKAFCDKGYYIETRAGGYGL